LLICEKCQREFTTKSGLSNHLKSCGVIKISRNGYEYFIGNDGKEVPLHRYIVEKELGRKLKSNEIVHHKDEIKNNNEPSNLEITNRSLHIKHHRLTLSKEKKEDWYSKFLQTKIKNRTNEKSLTAEQVKVIKIMLLNGCLQSDITRRFKVSGNTISSISTGKVWSHLKVNGFIECKNTNKIGSQNKSSKLNEISVKEIKNRILSGETLTSLAREYEVDQSTLSSIKHNKTWKHVVV